MVKKKPPKNTKNLVKLYLTQKLPLIIVLFPYQVYMLLRREHTIKLQALDRSTIQFWKNLAKGGST